jgi:hypothetical protein
MSSATRNVRRTLVLFPLLSAMALTGLTAQHASAESSVGGTIGTSEILSRAKNWYDRDIPYSQTSTATDVNGRYYRTDCSGFVSMAWHLSSSLTTSTLPDVSTVISKSSLRPGDALDNTSDGHVVLFVKWLDKSEGTFSFYQEANPSIDMAYGTADIDSGNIAGLSYANYQALRYDNSTDDSATATAADWKLQTVVNTSTSIYHNVRNASGTWQTNWGSVEGQSGSIGNIRAVADAAVSGDTHVLAVNSDDTLYHAIRYSDGDWSPFRSVEHVAGQLSGITDVAAVSIGQELHVVAVANGALYHTMRHADGSWDDWGSVYGKTGDAGTATAVSIASVAGEMHIAVVVSSGTVRHAIRHDDGTWTSWGNVENVAGDSGTPTDVAIAGVNGELQMIVISNSGTKYVHTIRHSDGSWDDFNSLSGVIGSGLTIKSVGAARVDGELQATFVTSDGKLLHTIRHSSGSWDDANSKSLTNVSGTILGTSDTGSL